MTIALFVTILNNDIEADGSFDRFSKKNTVNISTFVHIFVCTQSQRIVVENSTQITKFHNQQNWIR